MTDLPRGWLTAPEAAELRAAAEGRIVLELGAWRGLSTVVMADTARYIISVDRHQGIADIDESDSLPDYLTAVRTLENVAVVIATFEEFVPFLDGIEMVYVDGDHDVASVERDARLAADAEPEVVAFHDWDFEEVREGARRAGFVNRPDRLVGSVAVFEL